MAGVFSDWNTKLEGTSVMIKSKLNGQAQQILGTVLVEGLLLSKSAMVGDEILVALNVIARDKAHDLVLLKMAKKLKQGLKLSPTDTAGLTFKDSGKFLISALAPRGNRISNLSSMYFNQPRKFSSGYFGASATFKNEQIILNRIAPGSPAEVALTKMPVRPIVHPADQFEGGKSFRLDGFEQVFAHDAILRPEECGGPVFDLDGKFYGINIARSSRRSCLVISPKAIYEFLLRSL